MSGIFLKHHCAANIVYMYFSNRDSVKSYRPLSHLWLRRFYGVKTRANKRDLLPGESIGSTGRSLARVFDAVLNSVSSSPFLSVNREDTFSV